MSNIVLMPTLGLTMESGVIVEWRKKEGEYIEKGDILLDVESDKSTVEVESQYSGTLLKIYASNGSEVDCGEPICVLGEAGESIPDQSEGTYQSETIPETNIREPVTPEEPALPSVQENRVTASPRARRFARQKGINLLQIPQGSGPGGRIVEKDVISFASSQRISPLAAKLASDNQVNVTGIQGSGPGGRIVRKDVMKEVQPERTGEISESEGIPLSNTRKVIASKLSSSKFNAPHYYLHTKVNMENILSSVEKLTKKDPCYHISINSLIIKAAALALMKNRELNATFDGDKIYRRKEIDISFAVSTEKALRTPVLRDCANKSLTRIHEEFSHLAEGARGDSLSPEQYQGHSFSISNLGRYKIDFFTAIINPPAVAILSIGTIGKEPVCIDDDIVAQRTIDLVLSCDHRIIDGSVGAQFLTDLASILEEPIIGLYW